MYPFLDSLEFMPFQETAIEGVWIHTPLRHSDNRGHFEEQFKLSEFEAATGRLFTVMQVNQSVSNKGVVRGIHFTTGPIGQAKFVSCTRGRIWDVVVDLRESSQTFGDWISVELSPEAGNSVFIPEGLGHAFLSLEDGSVVNYLCSSEYSPEHDRTISPLSPALSIPFAQIAASVGAHTLVMSDKDSAAPEFYPK